LTAVFNTSPLIFLARLGYLEKTLSLFQMVAIPKKVIKEILEENKIKIEDINKLYETLKKIGFRVRREIFKNIFESSVSTCN